jgi:hypothetical protein
MGVDVRVAAVLLGEDEGEDKVRETLTSTRVVAATSIASRTHAEDWLEEAVSAEL